MVLLRQAPQLANSKPQHLAVLLVPPPQEDWPKGSHVPSQSSQPGFSNPQLLDYIVTRDLPQSLWQAPGLQHYWTPQLKTSGLQHSWTPALADFPSWTMPPSRRRPGLQNWQQRWPLALVSLPNWTIPLALLIERQTPKLQGTRPNNTLSPRSQLLHSHIRMMFMICSALFKFSPACSALPCWNFPNGSSWPNSTTSGHLAGGNSSVEFWKKSGAIRRMLDMKSYQKGE